MSLRLSEELNDEMDDLLGKEFRGRLNEYLILNLLLDKYNKIEQGKMHEDQKGLLTRELSDKLDLAQSTVATVVKRLSEKKLVKHSKSMPAIITPTGRKVATKNLRNHHLLEVWLSDALELSNDEVHNEATKLMLLASQQLINAIDDCFGHPEHCPRGHKIPVLV